MKSTEEIEKFYDSYQFKFRPNVRHYVIINKLVEAGLNSKSRVLEIGCGNGSLTKLIAPKVKSGKITALDISSESINTAKRNLSQYKNIDFVIGDVSQVNISEQYDLILLSDVLEHIRLEFHDSLFQKISELLDSNGIVFINIPEPKFLEWVTAHEPEKLQVVDQPIHTEPLLNIAYKHGLYLKELKSYSLFKDVPDSQYIVLVKRNKTFTYHDLPKWKIIATKYYNYLKNIFN